MNPLEIAAVSMQVDQQRLTTIAHNVANAATPGFKRSVLRADAFAAAMQSAALQTGDTSPTSTALDLREGALRLTSAPLDIAVQGEGFIELSSTEGRLVSRGGSLRLDESGRLVTAQGHPVLGLKGEIRIAAPPSAVSIDAAGKVRVNGQEQDQIKRLRFESNAALVPVEPGVYAAADAVEVPGDVALRSGYLEASNVNSAREMVQLMETARHYESMQRAIQAYDDVLEHTLRKLGEN
jgi:flagellar basal-body rod protein FlgF